MKKNEHFKKETHLGPKRRVRRRLGPFPSLTHSFTPPIVYSVRYNLYAYHKISISMKNNEHLKKKLTWGPNDAFGVVWALFRRCRTRSPPLSCILYVITCMHTITY